MNKSQERFQGGTVTRGTWADRLSMARPAKKDRPWQEEELQLAINMRDRGIPYKDIGITLSRSTQAVKVRSMRLIPPEERQAKYRHMTKERFRRRLLRRMAENAERTASNRGNNLKNRAQKFDIGEIKRRVALLDLVKKLLPDLKKHGREYKARCPFHKDKTPSFAINENKNVFFCYGCSAGGDVIKFYSLYHNIPWKDAIADLARHAGIEAGPVRDLQPRENPKPELDASEKRKRELDHRRCSEIWSKSIPAEGTLAQSYLSQRGIECNSFGGIPPSLRFHPSLDIAEFPFGDAPAMVALIKNIEGEQIGIHRTYLSADGKKLPITSPKKMLGRHNNGAVRLTTATRRMAIAEGIETGLSALSVLRQSGDDAISVWVALSLQNLAGGG